MVGPTRHTMQVSSKPDRSTKVCPLEEHALGEPGKDRSDGKYTSISFDNQDDSSAKASCKSNSRRINQHQSGQNVSRIKAKKARRSVVHSLIKRIITSRLFLIHIIYLSVPIPVDASANQINQAQFGRDKHLHPFPMQKPIASTLSNHQDIADDWARRIVPVVDLPQVGSSTLPSLTKRADRRILSEFVVKQGQKLLKNIASSVEDGYAARGQIYTNMASTVRPTSRLYDLLFPSISHFGNNENLISANFSGPIPSGFRPMTDPPAVSPKGSWSSNELVVPLNLSAPYESQARTWLTDTLTGRQQKSASNQMLAVLDGSESEGKLQQHEHGEISSVGAINWPTSVVDGSSGDSNGETLGEDGNQSVEVTEPESEPESTSQPTPVQAELGNQDSAGSIQDSNESNTIPSEEPPAEYQPEFNQSEPEYYTKSQFMPTRPMVENFSEYREEEQKPAASMIGPFEEANQPVEEISGDQTFDGQSDELATERPKDPTSTESADQYIIENHYLPAEHNAMRIKTTTLGSSSDQSSHLALPSNDSFLASNLPTQYDAGLMRLPPEGYYDDYFKPDVSSSTTPSQLQHTSADESPFFHDVTSNASMMDSGHLSSAYDNNHQLYMDQQAPRQHQATSNQNVEYIASNKSFSRPGVNVMATSYDEPGHDESRDLRSRQATSSFELTSSANQRPHSLNQTSAEVATHQIGEPTGDKSRGQNASAELQPVRLIIANTFSNSRDPKSNEKVISYTNEAGRNVTRQKSRPENNFVNREMNEHAPMMETKEKDKDTESQYMVTKLPDDDELTSTPSNFIVQPAVRPEVVDQDIKFNQDRDNKSARHFDPNQVDRVQKMIHDIGRMASTARLDGADSKWTATKGTKVRQKSGRTVGLKDNRPAREVRTRISKQPTLLRPQITQVNLNPKDLILNPPTPQPALSTASTISSIVELPTKVKRLKDNQPDKNELMNELLTALDRVKVAIYKLQPLTAKMNAIYRKSVTSNTRNLVMDNHKGTYAKRYPPGDYDDTYDRIHPADQASKHWSESRSRQRRAADLAPIAQESRNLPGHLSVSESNVSISNSGQKIKDGSRSIGSQIIATGIGWRLPGSNITSQLEVASEPVTDGVESDGLPLDSSKKMLLSRLGDEWPPSPIGGRKLNSAEEDTTDAPLFGYRITIYQTPDGDDQEEPRNDPSLVYQVSGRDAADEDDTMVTSESSISETPVAESVERIGSNDAPSESLYGSESTEDDTESPDEHFASESKEKKSEKRKQDESKSKKKVAKEKDKEDKSKSNKSQSKKKKDEEEVKKKKEYKKIKHNKGVVSKEKKTMHRDKHIKAHDRGAAKEKALKERTQIEFFEREQIVDDAYDKGKKSVAKANWQTGHESKKMNKDSGDTMPSGGSHYVKHEAKDGHAMGAEASISKSSSKFEKKQLEAKEKVFKGWREKGYKIITETEFIDRGSLHDSAYKKRDKGAAHHQKYKKHENSSEGHHGSQVEHKKKSHKKEEKKSKMNERKGKESKKDEKEAEEKRKKEKRMKKNKIGDNEHEESMVAPTVEPYRLQPADRQRQSQLLELSSTELASSTLGLTRTPSSDTGLQSRSKFRSQARQHQLPSDESIRQRSAASLMRLLNNEHDERSQPRHQTRMQAADTDIRSNFSALVASNDSPHFHDGIGDRLMGLTLTGNFLGSDSNRRSDQAPPLTSNSSLPKMYNSIRSLSSILPTLERNTILDIVDNSTGRQMNKTRIGTYDFSDDNGPISTANNSLVNSGTSAVSKNLAKIFSLAGYQQQQLSSDRTQPRSSTTPHNIITLAPVVPGQNLTTGKSLQTHKTGQKRPPFEPTGDQHMLDPQHVASRSKVRPDENDNARRLNNLINILPKMTSHPRISESAAIPASQVNLPELARLAPSTQRLNLVQAAVNSQANSLARPAQGYLINHQLGPVKKQSNMIADFLQPALNPLLVGGAPNFVTGQDQLGLDGGPSSYNMAFPFNMDYEQQDSPNILADELRNFFLERPNTI